MTGIVIPCEVGHMVLLCNVGGLSDLSTTETAGYVERVGLPITYFHAMMHGDIPCRI